MSILNLTWQTYQDLLNNLIERIKKSGQDYDGVFGIPRGGLIPAISISHMLKLPLLTAPTPKTLIIDDIYETGLTARTYWNHDSYNYGALIYKPPVTPNPWIMYGGLDTKQGWIVFPWENKKEAQKDYEEYKNKRNL
jgi:hypoxanthine phosphoribosyltransferase